MIAIWILAGFTVLYLLSLAFSAERRRKRLMASTPRAPIGQAAGGLTKIQGQLVHCWPPLQAPISGRPCAVYEVIVETIEENKTVRLIHEIRGQPFMLHDESGRAFVSYDEQTAIILRQDVKQVSGTLREPTPAMLALLQRHDEAARRIFGLNRPLQYREAVLEAGELVTAFGIAAREPDPDPATAYAVGYHSPTWLAIRAAPGTDLTITDELPFDQRPAAVAAAPQH
jgi:hypothetical protein